MEKKGMKPRVSIGQLESGFKAIFELLYHRSPQTSYKVRQEFMKASDQKSTQVTTKKVIEWMIPTYLEWNRTSPDKLQIPKFWKYETVAREYYHYLTGKILEDPTKKPEDTSRNLIPLCQVESPEKDGAGKKIYPGKKVFVICDNRCMVKTYYGYIIKDGAHRVLVGDEWRDVSEIYRSKNDFDDYVLEMLDQVKIVGPNTENK